MDIAYTRAAGPSNQNCDRRDSGACFVLFSCLRDKVKVSLNKLVPLIFLKKLRRAAWVPGLAGALMLFVNGCGKEDIRVYRVPKEQPQPALAALDDVHDPVEKATPPVLRWNLPDGWEEKPANGMRVGSFAVVKGEQQADVSIVPLGGAAGDELDNVNRWRGQLALAAFDSTELNRQAQEVEVGVNRVAAERGKRERCYKL